MLFQDGFENGLGNWTTSALWNLEADSDVCGSQRAPFPEGSFAAYMGRDGNCDYDIATGSGSTFLGGMTSSSIPLPAGPGRATLRFRYLIEMEFYDGDQCWDDAYVSSGSTILWRSCDTLGGPVPGWHEAAVDLTSFLGQSVAISFYAWVHDDQFNFYFGWLVDDVRIELEPGSATCGSVCPCANVTGTPPYDRAVGCRNSTGNGGLLAGGGAPVVSADTLVLTASGLPPSTIALLFQGSAATSVFMGDGLRCAGGTIRRLLAGQASGGVVQYPGPAPGLATVGGVSPAGETVIYQAYYRDNGPFCTPAAFNVTNAYNVTWVP